MERVDIRTLPKRQPLGLQPGEALVGTFILSPDGSVLFVFDDAFMKVLTPAQRMKLSDAFASWLGVGIVGTH